MAIVVCVLTSGCKPQSLFCKPSSVTDAGGKVLWSEADGHRLDQKVPDNIVVQGASVAVIFLPPPSAEKIPGMTRITGSMASGEFVVDERFEHVWQLNRLTMANGKPLVELTGPVEMKVAYRCE